MLSRVWSGVATGSDCRWSARFDSEHAELESMHAAIAAWAVRATPDNAFTVHTAR
jgi:hypothetical protein